MLLVLVVCWEAVQSLWGQDSLLWLDQVCWAAAGCSSWVSSSPPGLTQSFQPYIWLAAVVVTPMQSPRSEARLPLGGGRGS